MTISVGWRGRKPRPAWRRFMLRCTITMCAIAHRTRTGPAVPRGQGCDGARLADDPGGDGGRSPAHRKGLAIVSDEVQARAFHDIIRDHEFGIDVLGEPFQPARGVQRVADGRQARGLAVAHLSDDRRAGMQAHRDLERAVELAGNGLVERGNSAPDEQGRLDRLSGRFVRGRASPNRASTPSPTNLSTCPRPLRSRVQPPRSSG